MNGSDIAGRVRDFWFGTEGSDAFGTYRTEWFVKDPAYDDTIRAAFLGDVEAALKGDLDALGVGNTQDCLALLILLDQFPRNLFRGNAKSFAGDDRALVLAKGAIDRGFDIAAPQFQRFFFYLPFEHSEILADQDLCVDLVARLKSEDLLKYANAHRDIIVRFGRFPHRNAVLGRASTPQEVAFLDEPNSSF